MDIFSQELKTGPYQGDTRATSMILPALKKKKQKKKQKKQKKLITKFYTSGFLKQPSVARLTRFQNFYTALSLHCTGLPFQCSNEKSKCHDDFNSLIDVTSGFRSCVVVVILYCKSVNQTKDGETLSI